MQNPSSEATGGGGVADVPAAGFGYSLLPPCIFPVVTGGPASASGLPAGFLATTSGQAAEKQRLQEMGRPASHVSAL